MTSNRGQIGIDGVKVKRAAGALNEGERGVVIFTPSKIAATPGMAYVRHPPILSREVDPQELRYALLFWDRIEFPISNLYSLPSQPDVEFLVSEGIIHRSDVLCSPTIDRSYALAATQTAAYLELDSSEPGRWTMLRSRQSLGISTKHLVPSQAILANLVGCIPVPDKEVPLSDILEFKSKRRPELIALRHHLERLCQAIAAAPDPALSYATESEALDRALRDHIRVSKEGRFPIRISDAKVSISLAPGVLLEAMEVVSIGLPLSAAMIGLAADVISWGVSAGLKEARGSQSPYEYVANFNREVFIRP